MIPCTADVHASLPRSYTAQCIAVGWLYGNSIVALPTEATGTYLHIKPERMICCLTRLSHSAHKVVI